MIKIYCISNLKIIYNPFTGQSVILERDVDTTEEESNDLKAAAPLFSAKALTSQEKYLLQELLLSYSFNENISEKNQIIKSLEMNTSDLLTVISELNEQLIQCKNECAALQTEISELRRSKLD